MQLAFDPDDTRFRDEVRQFLRESLPVELAEAEAQGFHLHRHQYQDWHRILYEKGWAAPGWPSEHGGTGWTPMQRHIWEIEYGLANAPEISVIGIGLVGPLIYTFADEYQKRFYLPRILSGEAYFCQGFSETNAGSDLAQVRTSALRDGDDYLINGHKVWTSHAPYADYMICLCRTDKESIPQRGLSLFFIPMNAPGVTVRTIRTIDDCDSVSEVYLDNVRVSSCERLGEENKAWTYTKFLLNNERTHNAYLGLLKRYLLRLERQIYGPDAAPVSSYLRDQVAQLHVEIEALEWSVLRVLASRDDPHAAAAASALKVTASGLLLRASDLELAILGPASLPRIPFDWCEPLPLNSTATTPGKVPQYMYWRASSIFGGSNDIQKTIIWNTLYR